MKNIPTPYIDFIMRFLIVLLFAFSASLSTFSQGHVPKKNQIIKFSVPSEAIRKQVEGFDCFYTEIYAYNNGEYNFKKKYRFHQENGITPFSEIIGHKFEVRELKRIFEGDPKKDAFLVFLFREDGPKVILRIPYNKKDKNSNILTTSMVTQVVGSYQTYTISIPFFCVDDHKRIVDNFCNKEIVYSHLTKEVRRDNDGKDEFARDSQGQEVLEYVWYSCVPYPLTDGFKAKAIDVGYIDINDYAYQQEIIICEVNGKRFGIPLHQFYTEGPKNTKNNYSFENFFITIDNYKQTYFERENVSDIVNKFTGKAVYYGLGSLYDKTKEVDYGCENIRLSDNKSYTLTEGKYWCEGFDIFKRASAKYTYECVFAILVDSIGTKFRVPAKGLTVGGYAYNYKTCPAFNEAFMLVHEADAYKAQLEQAELKEKQERDNLYKRLKSTYGVKYADYLIDLGENQIFRFESFSKKWGKDTAYQILEGNVKIGWTKEMCRYSWGSPDHINRSTGKWGVHEQWVYEYDYTEYGGRFRMKFLYFDNGKLTSIDD